MNPATHRRRPFSARLLIELIRQREESAGHPEESPRADAAAIKIGGDLLDRIHLRARELPSAQPLISAIRLVINSGGLLGLFAVTLAAVGGIVAAAKSLEATSPANLPLALFVLIGLNVVTFLLWLLVQPFSHRIVGLGGQLRRLLQWLIEHPLSHSVARLISAQGRPAHNTAPPPGVGRSAVEVLGVIVADGRGRWLFGAAVHAIWLCFALASSFALAALLSFRSYELSWQTTLLNTQQLSAIARVLTLVPSKLGLVAVESLSITDTASALARQSWASWLVVTTLIYGTLPRAIAFCACCVLFRRSSRSMGCDLSRPGFARLRARLMPETCNLEVSDPDRAVRHEPPRPVSLDLPALMGVVHGLGVDGAARDGAPPLPGVEWIWLGQVDDPSSLAAVLKRLSGENVTVLAVAVRATMTPDRGVEHIVTELVAAARAPTVLILQDLDLLRARGMDQLKSRVSYWQALGNSAGARGLLSWQGEPMLADEKPQSPA